MRTVFWLIFVMSSCLYPMTTTAKINDPRSSKDIIDFIHIEKQKRQLTVFYRDKTPKTYRIALGFSPLGPKEAMGDGKTPEGIYTITYKNPASQFHRSLKLSYPAPQDWQRAKRKGVHPGSDIMIHGVSPRFAKIGKWHAIKDWTLGCIAVTNEEIDEIYHLAEVGTKVKISP
jgi:murein L,D-transpeptidase YafK